MEAFLVPLARAPHMCPETNPYRQPAMIQPRDVLLTLTTDKEERFDNITEPELQRKLETMERWLPQMVPLQEEKQPVTPPPVRHEGSFETFLKHLANNNYPRYYLMPLPSLDNVSLNNLLTEMLGRRVARDRAAWVIHHYARKRSIMSDDITRCLMESAPTNFGHFAGVCWELYERNLVRHGMLVQWMIERIPPMDMVLFQGEFLKVHQMLLWALESQHAKEYMEVLTDDLMLNRVQLVQLALKSAIEHGKPYQDFVTSLLNGFWRSRAQRIWAVISGVYMPASVIIRRYLFGKYPDFDLDDVMEKMENFLQFVPDDKRGVYAVDLLECIKLCKQDIVNCAAVVACVMKKANILISAVDFLKWTMDNLTIIENIGVLFHEMQYQGILEYSDVIRVIKYRGYWSTMPKETVLILHNFPCAHSRRSDLRECHRMLRRCAPEQDFERELSEILESPIEKADLTEKLPYAFRYQIALWTIRNFGGKLSSVSLVEYLFKLGTASLLPVICEKLLPSSCFRNVCPLFAAHRCADVLDKFDSMISSDESHIRYDRLIALFQKYSYLCSLEVYDAIFAVKTINEFRVVFTNFIEGLLKFDQCNVDVILNFQADFCASQCVDNARKCFLVSCLMLYLQKPGEYDLNFLKSLLTRMFSRSAFDAQDFLFIVFELKLEYANITQDAVIQVVDVFYSILDNLMDKGQVTINRCISDAVVSGFKRCFGVNSPVFTDLLSKLRERRASPPLLPKNHSDDLAAAMFSLLPMELLAGDSDTVFSFFEQNVSDTNYVLWSTWLKDKPHFNPSFPVTHRENVTDTEEPYYRELVTKFRRFLSCGRKIFLRCWSIICESVTVSDYVADSFISDQNCAFDFVYPALSHITTTKFTTLCEKLAFSRTPSDEFVSVACPTFLVFMHKVNPRNGTVISISERILEWLPRLYKQKESTSVVLAIDTFNFIICSTVDATDAFQIELHQRIQSLYKDLPSELKKQIILNQSPYTFNIVKDPLFSDFVEQEAEPPRPFGGLSEPPDTQGFNNDFSFLEMEMEPFFL